MSLLELQHISYRYPLTPELTIKDLSLKVEPGEVLGIVGCLLYTSDAADE